jgi:YcaO-like protein with predicted kinase domain
VTRWRSWITWGRAIWSAADRRGALGDTRPRPVEETLASLAPRLADLGITRVIELTPLDRIGVDVFNLCVPNRHTECYSAGKGLTREAALVSGLMEALEIRCVTALHPGRALLGRRRDEVPGALDPTDLPLPFRQDLTGEERHDWLPCVELGSGDRVFLPADLFGFAYGKAPGVSHATAHRSTNGTGAGNSLVEATVQALYELVERDATVLSSFGVPRPLGSSTALLERLERAGISAYVFDLTTDIGLPVYQVYLVEPCGISRHHRHAGFGCHRDPEIALVRAITEACQVRLTYFAGAREDVDDPIVDDAVRDALVAYHAEGTPVPLPAEPSALDPSAALDEALARLAAVGCPAAYLADLSLPAFEQRVVRVWVPGLEGPFGDGAGGWQIGERGWRHRERQGARRFGF